MVETTAVVDATGAHPLPQRELSPEMLGLVQHAKAYERLAVKAACSGSRDDVVRALLANPLVGQYPLAADLADELLGANRTSCPVLPVVSRVLRSDDEERQSSERVPWRAVWESQLRGVPGRLVGDE